MGGPVSDVLVLQLCRLGDILQTTPMLRGLRRERPGSRITLVVHDGFRNVPVPAALYDRVVGFPQSDVEGIVSADPSAWPIAVDRVDQWVRDLGGPFDEILNLTHNDLSGLLAALIPARSVQGCVIAPDRRRIVRGDWMAYFWSSQQARAQGCFNLVDINNRAAGVGSDRSGLAIEIGDHARAAAGAWLGEHGLAGRPIIAVQLGASEERKRWPPELFADAIDHLSPEIGEVVLVGTPDEQPLADRLLARTRRQVYSAVGQTSIQSLAALLSACRVLVTNDTGTMHVAAAAGTRVIDLSTGPVYVHETAPYGEGHFVLEPCLECFPCAAGAQCHHFACRDQLTPLDVSALISHAEGRGPMPRPAAARIMRGRFTASGRITYTTLWSPVSDFDEIVREASARMWESSLGSGRGSQCEASAIDTEPFEWPVEHLPGSEVTASLHRLAAQSLATARLAVRLSTERERQGSDLGERVSRELNALELMSQLEPLCRPLVAFLRTRLECIEETQLRDVARRYASECRATAVRARGLARLLETQDSLVPSRRPPARNSVRVAREGFESPAGSLPRTPTHPLETCPSSD